MISYLELANVEMLCAGFQFQSFISSFMLKIGKLYYQKNWDRKFIVVWCKMTSGRALMSCICHYCQQRKVSFVHFWKKRQESKKEKKCQEEKRSSSSTTSWSVDPETPLAKQWHWRSWTGFHPGTCHVHENVQKVSSVSMITVTYGIEYSLYFVFILLLVGNTRFYCFRCYLS